MPVVKVIEIIGESPKSWEDAAQNAVATAGRTLRNVIGVHVQSMTAKVDKGKIIQFRTTVKIAFRLEEISA
jgi:flavin-binding protein dodecin